MSSVERVGMEDLVMTSTTHQELRDSRWLRPALEVAIPILLSLVYVAILFLNSEP